MVVKKTKIIIGSVAALAVLAGASVVGYLKVLPWAVSNPQVVSFVEKAINKAIKVDINIQKPVLKTSMNPVISFSAEEISLSKNDKNILAVNNLDTEISFKDIFKKRIAVDKFAIDYIFADVNKLMELAPKQEQTKKQESDWDIDLYDSVLSLKKSLILYSLEPDINIKLKADNLYVDNTQKLKRNVHFIINTEIEKAGKVLHFAIADKNRVVIANKQLTVDDCVLDINHSNVHINASASRANGIDINLSSKKFKVKDVIDIVDSNIIVNNGSEILALFKDMNGDFNFDINLAKNGMNGVVNLNSLSLKLVPLNNIFMKLDKGKAVISSKDIKFTDIAGYYGSSKTNRISIEGIIKDYVKSCDTDVTIKTVATDEFARDYLSKLTGVSFSIIGNAGTVINVKSIYNKIDVMWASKLAKGEDILVEGSSLSPVGWDRAVKADMHFENNILNIKDINYYIASELVKGVKVKPVLTLKGNIDLSKPVPVVMDLGFDIPKPLPSEFLNVLVGQKFFKGGKFSGELALLNNGPYPVIKGHMNVDNVRIPSQRVRLKHGELKTDKDGIYLKSNGRFRRSNFAFSGNFANAVKFPIVVKDIDFELDKIDIDKILNAFNKQNTSAVKKAEITDVEYDDNDDTVVFDVNDIIIERCILKLKEGNYKDINFGNISANLTLNKDNVLELHSNRFDIAEGISSVKVLCDLKKHKYNITLGIKDVNSDTMSASLLNLPREISGKASGLIDLHTDDSLKLNGIIKFLVKDGTIQKVGLVEYVLKFAAIFRNPLAMISPSIFSDMVNIPEGNFDKITGEMRIKDNVVEMMKIKSYSPQLSAYIAGRYNLENSDASLRIYTKFSNKNKGFAGALRNISLNSLANRIPLSSRTDAQYYSAELEQLPEIDAEEKDCQIFLTKVDGDVEHNNFLSSLKKLK